jgi:hypothetical protein
MRALLTLALLSGCARDSLPANDDGGRTCDGEVRLLLPPAPRRKVDVLFVLDNSNVIVPLSDFLKNSFGKFISSFEDMARAGTAIDLQLGVVTSDYGAGETGAPGCQPSPGGQQGRLQAVGAAAPMTCKPPVGAFFARYDFADPQRSNLPIGQDLATTFTCMASTGYNGCGFEHPLESAYAALHNQIPENAGFVRDDALLAVFFATDEDDCSAPTDSPLFDKNKTAQYGYEDSFRCTRFGLVCGTPATAPPYGDSMGPLADCKPAPNPGGGGPGLLYDIHRYTDFFARPFSQGGVKTNPDDVIVAALDAPDSPVQVILSNPGAIPGEQPGCAQLNEASNPPCVPMLEHSCRNQAKPFLTGDAAVRLNTVVRSARTNAITSLCDSDDVSPALTGLADLIFRRAVANCLPAPLLDAQNPDCAVADETQNSDGTVTSVPLARCGGGAFPCWRVDKQPACKSISPQSLGISIDRNGLPPPPDTRTRVACAVGCT